MNGDKICKTSEDENVFKAKLMFKIIKYVPSFMMARA